ncbi:hypothetical protein QE152_g6783 [Popillia japonica]|uniref:Uncharacterized protein n=1 Tax=Popillia japonica TaxID=7064 RepID=A0AAW1MGW0_POPJA
MAYNSSRPLTQKELAEIIEDLSVLEADDKSDISEEDKVIEEKNDFESDSVTAGTSSSLVECENIEEEEIPVQNNEERTAKDVNNDNIYLQIEDVPTKLRGKNGSKWSGKPGKKSFRTTSRNLVIHLPGNKGSARDVSSGLEAWSLFFSDDILNNTRKILVQRKKYASDRPNDDEDVANTCVHPIPEILIYSKLELCVGCSTTLV